MTREEAIKILKAIRVYECYPKSASEETKEAIEMAIEALKEKNRSDSLVRDDAENCKESESKLDLISRQDALCILKKKMIDRPLDSDRWVIRDIAVEIKSLPSAKAVDVVRCKDCKHRDPEDQKCDCGHDIMWQLPREDDWFCCDGMRKDGESDERPYK